MAKGYNYPEHVAGKNAGATTNKPNAETTTGLYLRQRASKYLKKPLTWISIAAITATATLGALYKDQIVDAFNSFTQPQIQAEEVETEIAPLEDLADEKEPVVVVETEEKNPYEIATNKKPNEQTKQESKTIDDIIFYTTDEDMFGPDADPSNMDEVVSADPEKMERINKIVYSAVSMYPEDFLVENLDRIYILSELGTKINGSYHPLLKRVYVEIDPEPGRGDNDIIESIIHSEISSILLEPNIDFVSNEESYSKYFNEKAWKAINPDFLNISSLEAVKRGLSPNFKPNLFDESFLSTYSRANIEEDFNLFAGYMLTDYEPFWTAVKEHEKLKQKLDLTKEFYIALDKGFEPILEQQYETHGLECDVD